MPDYKALYFELFRASEQAIRLLQDAQLRAEKNVMDAEPTVLHFYPEQQGPEASGSTQLPDRHAKGSPFGGAGNAGGVD